MNMQFVKLAKRMARRIIGRPIFGRSILIYHRVATADFDPWNISVSPDQFEQQLAKLRTKVVLPLQEFVRLHNKNGLPRNAVAITFDDGYACNALVAAPMLKSFGYPATIFVVSDTIARPDEFWWDQLEFIFRSREFNYDVASRVLNGRSVGVSTEYQRDDTSLTDFLVLWSRLRGLSTEERRQCLDHLRQVFGLTKTLRPTHRPMTTEELRALAADPLFEIGGHTATHPSLPTLTPAEQEQEILSGAGFLEATIGRPIRSFSYPFGEWLPATRDIVKAAGFKCALVTQQQTVRPGDNPFELPRRQVVNRYAYTP
jgi:peptidoglycan/xylan/chitin deacetylase (PgdA/CDA1 family)